MFDWVLNTPFQSTYYNLSFVNPLMSGGKKDYKYLKKPAASTYDLLLPPDVKGLKLLFTFTSCLPQVKKFYRKTSCPQAFERSRKIKQNAFIYQGYFQSVVTKTGKRPQTTTNKHKPPANDHKLPQTTIKRPQNTTNDPKSSENDRKPPANDHKPPANNHERPSKPFPNSNYLVFS